MTIIPKFIPINWLEKQGYCEYQLYLQRVRNVPNIDDEATIKGTLIHTELGHYHSQLVTATLPLNRAIDKSLETTIPFVKHNVPLQGNRLMGECDHIEFYPSRVQIIDDKPRSPNGEPFISEKRQVKGYCYAFIGEHPELKLPVYAVINNEDTGYMLWREEFSSEDVADLEDTINCIIGILDGSREPVDTKNKKNKCPNCRFRAHCDKSK